MKLFSKIATLSVGLALAIGVGVALAGHADVKGVSAAGGTYEKISSLSDLTSGAKYLIVSEQDNLAFDGSLSTIDAVSNTQSVTISNNSIATTSDIYFTIESKSGGYSILGFGGKYIGSTAPNSNELKSSTSDDYSNTIAWDSTNSCFTIRGTNSYLIYNSTSGQTRFRYFKPGTCGNGVGTGAYHKISLFKESGGGEQCEHDWEAGETHAPTCTAEGYTEYTCSICGDEKHDDIVAALGHDYGEWIVDTPASCTTAGSQHRVCSHDTTHVENEVIPATGHNYVDGECTVCHEKEPNSNWVLVDDISTLVADDRVILTGVKNEVTYAAGLWVEGKNNVPADTTNVLTVSGNKVTGVVDTMVYTLETGSVAGSFAFKGSDGKYLYAASSSGNQMKAQSNIDANASFTLGSDGTVAAKSSSNRNYMRFNPNASNDPLFSCYASTSSTGSLVTFYKYEESVDPSLKTMQIDGGETVPFEDTAEFGAYDGETLLTGVSWSVSDPTVLDFSENGDGKVSVSGLKEGSANLIAELDGYNKVEKTLTVDIGEYIYLILSGSMSKTEYTSAESWDPTGFTVKAHSANGYEKDVTSEVVATWTYDPAAPAEGVTSVVATAHYLELSKASSAQTVSVEVAHAGTAGDPFTVAEGIVKCQEIGQTASGDWYVKGIVSAITSSASEATQYGNITFNLSDDGNNENFLIAFQVKNIGAVAFTAETFSDVQLGYIVVVHGALVNYKGNTPEFAGKGASSIVSIEVPEQDVDISFDPSVKSYEIGDTGTFVATSETSGAVITYSVDKPTILSVNETTGAFEALGLGVARVTATASAGGKEGSLYVDIIVNGSTALSVSEANSIASSLESGGVATSYYVYVEGYVAEFGTSMDKSNKPRALDIMDESGNRIMVYTNVDPYPSFIDGLSLGDYLKVKAKVQNYYGTYELTDPEKVSSSYSAWSLAFEILSETDAVCNEYDGVTDNADAIAAKWGTLGGEGHYASLNSAEKAKLIEGEAKVDGTTLEQALARYDYLTAKYDLDGFIIDRAPSAGRYTPANLTVAEDSNVAIAVVAIVAVASISAIAVILIIKRRKAFDR